MKVRSWFVAVAVSVLAGSAQAATRYVAVNGSDSNPGSAAQPWATFAHAFSEMASGDTLLVKDGTYNQNMVSWYGTGFPSGTPAAYTIIRAENDWKVTVNGNLQVGPAGQNSYFLIRGIHFMEGGGVQAHHAKIIRCSFRGTTCTGNTTVMALGSGSNHVLVEECFAYGCGRYKFMAFGDENGATEKIIFRRCVSRHDYHAPDPDWGRQSATYVSYDTHDFVVQNSISIDSGDDDPMLYGQLYGGVWFENKQTTGQDNSGDVLGSIFLNLGGLGALHDPKNHGARRIENTVIWDSKGGYTGGSYMLPPGVSPTLRIKHLTVGNTWGSFQDTSHAWGTGTSFERPGVATISDSLLTQNASYGIANYVTSDYNDYFANGANFGSSYGVPPPVAGPNDRSVNPSMKYLCRVEDDSPLKGAASDGGDIGATILKRWGVAGTLYGEPGWDTLTNEPLWPFPNEDVIKQTMSAWVGPNNAQRGFCAPGNGLYGGPITLSSYIWEYLGYPCPEGICQCPRSSKGDFGTDGRPELIWRNLNTNRHMIWTMNGASATQSSWLVPDPPAGMHVVGADDVDANGRSDLLLANPGTGAVEFWLMNGAARQGAAIPLAAPLGPPWKLSATGDWNADGKPDLLWRNSSTQKIRIWTMNGTTKLGELATSPDQAVDGNWEIVAALDYNGDGVRDLLWYNWSSGKIVLWIMNSALVRVSGTFTDPANAGDNNWKVLAGGEYSTTTRASCSNDFVWRNATSGRSVLWEMDNAGARVAGSFTTPDGPSTDPSGQPTVATGWILAGPR